MEIIVSKEHGRIPVTILQIAGQLDRQTYRQLIDRARLEFDAGARSMLLDLAQATYLSSAGMVALHTIALMLRGETPPDPDQGWSALKSMDRSREGGLHRHLKLLDPRPEVMNALELVGFSDFFEVFTDRRKALESF